MTIPNQGPRGIYEPLPRQCFSLIKFDQNRFRNEHIVELTKFQIGKSPAYHALSYTWGPPLNTKECEDDYKSDSHRLIKAVMTRDGQYTSTQELSITRNLFECPRVLTSIDYIWIDAICINQEDNIERAIQVPLMGSIYANARQVIIWLGRDESNLEDFKWIHEILYPPLSDYVDTNGIGAFDKVWDAEEFDANLGVNSGIKWDAYAKFMEERRWFCRAWIVQEISLASSFSILAGRSEISWDTVTNLAWFLNQVGSDKLLTPNIPMR
jgi:hypothetical protein